MKVDEKKISGKKKKMYRLYLVGALKKIKAKRQKRRLKYIKYTDAFPFYYDVTPSEVFWLVKRIGYFVFKC